MAPPLLVSASGGEARLPTGVDGLDTVLNGGLFRGSAYIVHGPPGAGKTVLSNQICFAQAAVGRRALYLSLLTESHDRMLQHLSGMGFVDRRVVPASIVYLSAYQTLEQEGLDGLLRLAVREMRALKADLVVVDGFFVAGAAAGDENTFRRFVHELQGQGAILGATVLLVTNEGRTPASPEHTMVDGWIELIDELHEARSVRTLVVRKQRGGRFLRGRHQFRISDAGIRVFPRLESLAGDHPVAAAEGERVTTGIAGLDRMTAGGYPAASATVIAGPTGAGKTTLGLHFLSASRPEDRGLLFGLHETPARLKLKARSLGIDLEGLMEAGAVDICWQTPGENLSDELGHRLIEHVERGGFRRVFVDGLKPLAHAFVYPRRLPVFINALNNILKARGASMLYTMEIAELHMPASIATIDLSALFDNLILVHYGRNPDLIQREMVILKMRDSDFDPLPEPFHVTSEGLRFGPEPARHLRPEPGGGP